MAEETKADAGGGSPQRVALELMKHIADYETGSGVTKDRKYFLSLYRQCLKATRGHNLESVLKAD